MKKIGICKLTLEEGKFVDSHIIPKALTKPQISGGSFTQIGEGTFPTRRWTSWYDPALVIRKGEDILTEYDTAAIAEFRKFKLVWSSWETNDLGELHTKMPDSHIGFRSIKGINVIVIRLFILSLLWRACVTTLPEFKNINLPSNDINLLREIILEKKGLPIFLFPIRIYQLSTKGFPHNHTPLMEKFPIPTRCPITKSKYLNIVRFYFDGLIIHIHLTKTLKQIENFGKLILGNDSDALHLVTLTYENSLQSETINSIMQPYGFKPKMLPDINLLSEQPIYLYKNHNK